MRLDGRFTKPDMLSQITYSALFAKTPEDVFWYGGVEWLLCREREFVVGKMPLQRQDTASMRY
ncbi:hypothetical protein N7494_011242 [Penicillium frequentans]|uniref:Uncharacterized protein n=1 Tax=Penicillium frequentans TaxID=3151616 RepID=A0AAD6CJA5_9EURO|nr:hypothetical protein N7494_011242 [Penicillium glabrum]